MLAKRWEQGAMGWWAAGAAHCGWLQCVSLLAEGRLSVTNIHTFAFYCLLFPTKTTLSTEEGGQGGGKGGAAYCGWLECMTLLALGRLSLTNSFT